MQSIAGPQSGAFLPLKSGIRIQDEIFFWILSLGSQLLDQGGIFLVEIFLTKQGISI
jgi:hypothetical protein